MPIIPADQMQALAAALFEGAGATAADAAALAEALVDSNLKGHDSHGVMRIPYYARLMREGSLRTDVEPTVIRESATTAVVDGGWTYGQKAARFAARLAIEKARASHVAAVGIVRMHHIGRLGEYAEMMAAAGMYGTICVGGHVPRPAVAPHGGAEPIFATNPWAFGLPAGVVPTVLLDVATSVIAEGKLQVARAKHETVAPGTILDKEGRSTTDPNDFYAGGVMLPFGGHKGYGLAVIADLLGGYVTGCDAAAAGEEHQLGAFITAVDLAPFRPIEELRAAADGRLREIKSRRPAPGFDEVLVPGEPEQRSRASRGRDGIPLPDDTWAALLETAREVGVDVAQLAPSVP